MTFIYLKKFIITVCMIVISIIFFIECGEKGSQPVARVGGRTITVKEFEDSFSRGKSQAIIAKSTLQEKLDHLNKMIDKELQIVAAYRINLDKNDEVKKKVERRGEAAILRRLIDLEVIEPNIPDSEIKKIYKKSKKQVKISEIVLKMSANPTDQEQKVIENRIDEINLEIKKGTDFSKLVQEYSMETKHKVQGSFLKWSAFNAEDPVYQKAFSMKVGEISEPIKTKEGYSIIKVLDIKDVERKPYSQERRRIKNELLRLRGKELEKKYFQYLDNLKEKYHAQFLEENIQKFIKVMQDTSRFAADAKSVFNRFTNDEKKLPLVKYDGGEITIDKFVNGLSKLPISRRPDLKSRDDIVNSINRAIFSKELLVLESTAKDLKKDKEVKQQLKLFCESFMLKKIREMEVKDKINLSEEDLKKYFEEHREEFKNPEQREVREIYVKDQKLADEIFKRAKAGEDFKKLARKYNERTSTKNKDGYRGFIYKSTYGIGKYAFDTKVGDIAGPIKFGKSFSIIKVLSIKEAGYKTYEEAKKYVNARAVRKYREERAKEWLAQLRQEIEVTIYNSRLENTFSK